MNSNDFKNEDLEKILSRLDSIEDRISVLESNKEQVMQLQSVSGEETEDDDSVFTDLKFSISAPFESNLGEYGLAWLGNIVLFFAIAFLWQYFNDAGKPVISLITGTLSVTGVFVLSHYLRKSYSYLSFLFSLFGFIIMYYIVLRLHYYNINQLVSSRVYSSVLLLMVVGAQMFFAVRKQSQLISGVALILGLFTGFVSEYSLVFFLISLTANGLAVYLFWKYNWWKAMVFILCAGFLLNMFWLLDNPVSLVKTPSDLSYHYAFIYFSVITAIYSLVAFRRADEAFPENLVLSALLLAGITYSALLLAVVFIHFPTAYMQFFTAISIFCIAYSVILKLYSPWKYSPALFALFGFVAISVTIFGIYHFPAAFLLLICQSFLVLALALWYRSYIITFMNTFLLVTLAIVYYNLSGTLAAVNFTIPLVAFLSARIINWQRERLNIKTEFIRNIYLFTLFFSLLYATYFGLPGQFITVSWLLIAGIYFVLSIVLKSIKYRWMAMGNLLVAAFYLFLVDLAKIDLIFRILIFLVFAITTIVISTYYVKKLKNKSEESEN